MCQPNINEYDDDDDDHIYGRDVTELYTAINTSESWTISQKHMDVYLTVLEIQRQKWTGVILPPLAGIRVK